MKSRAARGLLIYAALILVIAFCRAWQVYSAPFECGDGFGHGPDPGTSECNRAIESLRERRTSDTIYSLIQIFALGGVVLGAYGALRLSLRIGFVRRFADGGNGSS
jgi:hypothetical protein